MTPTASRALPTVAWRWGRVLLTVGVVAALYPLSGRLPHEQAIRLELTPAQRHSGARIAVTWTKRGDADPSGGFTLRVPENAPPSIRHELSMPNGDYSLDLDVELGRDGSAGTRSELHRIVTLNGGEVRILLENTQQ